MTFLNDLSSDVQLLLVLSAFLLPIGLMIGIFTWRDARRREMNPVLWTITAVLTPALVGFILYLFARSNHSHLLCTACGSIVRPSDTICPSCGTKLKPVCKTCGNEVASEWKTCPVCSGELEEHQDLTPTARPKNKALWAMLLVLIVVPLFLAYFIGYYVIALPESMYFHTRYTLEAQANYSVLDPMYLNPESWYSYTLTNSEGITTVRRDMNGLYSGDYVITRPDGTIDIWGSSLGMGIDHTQKKHDIISESLGALRMYVCEGDYTYDEHHRLLKLIRSMDTDYVKHPEFMIEVTFSYDEIGNLIQQQSVRINNVFTPTTRTEVIDETTRHIVNYTYDESGCLSLSQEYDHSGTLTGYTVYTWAFDGTIRTAQNYTPDGTENGRTIVAFRKDGQILRQEFYDETNRLIQSAQFSYDSIQALMTPLTLFELALIWLGVLCFAGYVVSAANKETY